MAEQQMQAMAAQIAELANAVQQLRVDQQQAAQAAAQAGAANAAGAAGPAGVGGGDAGVGGGAQAQGALLDTRLLRGLEQFDGSAKAWRDWAVVARSYFACVDARLQGLMTRVENEPHLDVTLDAQEPGSQLACRRLYTLLIHSCKGGVLDRVINAGPGEGLKGLEGHGRALRATTAHSTGRSPADLDGLVLRWRPAGAPRVLGTRGLSLGAAERRALE